jgi:DNA polymerase-3 subunit beta
MTTKKNGNGKPWIIEVDRNALIQGLNLVGTAIDRRSTIPILTHVLCRVQTAGRGSHLLDLIGTDLDVRIVHRIKCESTKHEGEFTLPWHGLSKALAAIPTSKIGISVFPDLRVVIEDASAVLRYETLPPADFPASHNVKATATAAYVVGAGELRGLIEHVRHAVSDDASRFYLNGAYFHCVEKGILKVVTTDGHRMVIDQVTAENITLDAPKIIVPTKALKAVLKHWAAAPSAAVEIASNTTGISFDFGLGRVIESKTIDGSFPDYTRVIPTTNDKTVLLDADELDTALAKFPPAVGTGWRTREGAGVKLTFAKNNLTLSREAINDKPGITLKVRCEWEGPAFEIGFNPAYLRDALSVLGETVGFAFADPGSPALVMSGEYPQITLMPMRV